MRPFGFSSGHFCCISIPEVESINSSVAVRDCGKPIALGAEDRVCVIVIGKKTLCLPRRFEPAHPFLAFSFRPVRALNSILQTFVRAMNSARSELADRLEIAPQLVRHNDPGRAESSAPTTRVGRSY